MNKISIWFMTIRLCGFDKAVEQSTGMRAKRRITEKPRLSSDDERPNCILCIIIIRCQIGMIQVPEQFGPVIQKLIDCFRDIHRWRSFISVILKPAIQFIQYRLCQFLSHAYKRILLKVFLPQAAVNMKNLRDHLQSFVCLAAWNDLFYSCCTDNLRFAAILSAFFAFARPILGIYMLLNLCFL